jgi:hypothetical protein
MSGSSYIGAYWGSRPEAVEACAERLAQFLKVLSATHRLLDMRFKTGRVAKRGPIDVDAFALKDVLLKGRSRGADGSIIDEIGFTVGLWNGDRTAAGLTVSCGAGSRTVGNAVVVKPPDVDGAGLDVYQPGIARKVIEGMVECWGPEWATWSSVEMYDRQGAGQVGVVVGWMTYVGSRYRVSAAALPAGVEAEPSGDGTLLTLGEPGKPIPSPRLLATLGAIRPA